MKTVYRLLIAFVVVSSVLGHSRTSKPVPVIVETNSGEFNPTWNVGEGMPCYTSPEVLIDKLPVYMCGFAIDGWFMASTRGVSLDRKQTGVVAPEAAKAAFLSKAQYLRVHVTSAGFTLPADPKIGMPQQTLWHCTKQPEGSIDCP